jgi:hypothetical protein
MQCRECQVDKDYLSFAWKVKNKRKQTICKDCQSTYRREHYEQNRSKYIEKAKIIRRKDQLVRRQLILEYKQTHPCVDCGECDPVVLDFDHINGKKLFNIAEATSRVCSLVNLHLEMQKCVIRCANCHRRKTARERHYGRS